MWKFPRVSLGPAPTPESPRPGVLRTADLRPEVRSPPALPAAASRTGQSRRLCEVGCRRSVKRCHRQQRLVLSCGGLISHRLRGPPPGPKGAGRSPSRTLPLQGRAVAPEKEGSPREAPTPALPVKALERQNAPPWPPSIAPLSRSAGDVPAASRAPSGPEAAASASCSPAQGREGSNTPQRQPLRGRNARQHHSRTPQGPCHGALGAAAPVRARIALTASNRSAWRAVQLRLSFPAEPTLRSLAAAAFAALRTCGSAASSSAIMYARRQHLPSASGPASGALSAGQAESLPALAVGSFSRERALRRPRTDERAVGRNTTEGGAPEAARFVSFAAPEGGGASSGGHSVTPVPLSRPHSRPLGAAASPIVLGAVLRFLTAGASPPSPAAESMGCFGLLLPPAPAPAVGAFGRWGDRSSPSAASGNGGRTGTPRVRRARAPGGAGGSARGPVGETTGVGRTKSQKREPARNGIERRARARAGPAHNSHKAVSEAWGAPGASGAAAGG